MSNPIDQEIRILRAIFWSERDPEGRAFVPLADAYLRRGSPEEALSLLEDGLARHPTFSSGHLVAARVHRAMGDGDRASTALAAALSLDPGNASALRMKGEFAERAGDRALAIASFREALARNPSFEDLPGRVERLEAGLPLTPEPIEPVPGLDEAVDPPAGEPDLLFAQGSEGESDLGSELGEDPPSAPFAFEVDGLGSPEFMGVDPEPEDGGSGEGAREEVPSPVPLADLEAGASPEPPGFTLDDFVVEDFALDAELSSPEEEDALEGLDALEGAFEAGASGAAWEPEPEPEPAVAGAEDWPQAPEPAGEDVGGAATEPDSDEVGASATEPAAEGEEVRAAATGPTGEEDPAGPVDFDPTAFALEGFPADDPTAFPLPGSEPLDDAEVLDLTDGDAPEGAAVHPVPADLPPADLAPADLAPADLAPADLAPTSLDPADPASADSPPAAFPLADPVEEGGTGVVSTLEIGPEARAPEEVAPEALAGEPDAVEAAPVASPDFQGAATIPGGVEASDVEGPCVPEDPLPVTRTLGELYARQGLVPEAISVFRRLLERHPEDPTLLGRLAELEGGRAEPGDARPPEADEVEPEAAPVAGEGEQDPALSLPSEPVVADPPGVPEPAGEPVLSARPVADYFQDLLSWTEGAVRVEELAPGAPGAAPGAVPVHALAPGAAGPPPLGVPAPGTSRRDRPPEGAPAPADSLSPETGVGSSTAGPAEEGRTEDPAVAEQRPAALPGGPFSEATPSPVSSSEPAAAPAPPSSRRPESVEESVGGLDDFQDWLRSLNR